MSPSIAELKEHLTLLHDWFVPQTGIIKYKEHPWDEIENNKIGESLDILKGAILKIDENLFEPYSHQWAKEISGAKVQGEVVFFKTQDEKGRTHKIECLGDIVQLTIGTAFVNMATIVKTRLDFLNLLKKIGFEKE